MKKLSHHEHEQIMANEAARKANTVQFYEKVCHYLVPTYFPIYILIYLYYLYFKYVFHNDTIREGAARTAISKMY